MKLVVLIFSLLAIGCDKGVPLSPPVLTRLQQQAMENYPIDQRAYMEDCLTSKYVNFSYCQEKMIRAFNPQPQVKSGSNVLGTAAGTALGYGAAKLLLGK